MSSRTLAELHLRLFGQVYWTMPERSDRYRKTLQPRVGRLERPKTPATLAFGTSHLVKRPSSCAQSVDNTFNECPLGDGIR